MLQTPPSRCFELSAPRVSISHLKAVTPHCLNILLPDPSILRCLKTINGRDWARRTGLTMYPVSGNLDLPVLFLITNHSYWYYEAALYQIKARNRGELVVLYSCLPTLKAFKTVYPPRMGAAAPNATAISIFRPRAHQASTPACSVNDLPASGPSSQAGKWRVARNASAYLVLFYYLCHFRF
jgi:hypothetical protein